MPAIISSTAEEKKSVLLNIINETVYECEWQAYRYWVMVFPRKQQKKARIVGMNNIFIYVCMCMSCAISDKTFVRICCTSSKTVCLLITSDIYLY